ncbi:cycloisomaltooligosaccharide glucanotransferase [Asticcacaulis sp. AC460]|uniref:3-keto-disaccharide hydrolase n=1 Tax=Asticcacaulis sp. AC460 TaxID=1282360 RepID=UPI0003C3DC48|nr:DUF1080 domain-containing protein [Asticcacaulis sp. AC460]ESQ91741.1 cycloisomaltooligosaccharide glucanotransferase [Asticcacaulis sp. AC460]
MKKLMILGLWAVATAACAQSDYDKSRATEVYTPVPKAVDTTGPMPSDAIVLFDGKNLDAWDAVNGGAAKWTLGDGAVEVTKGTGDIRTKQNFCDVQLHVEWMTPAVPAENAPTGQGRNNSGVFLQERYEVQVLDSYQADTYVNGQAGSVYKQSVPLVNASRPPLTWQTYDIVYKAPKFDAAGKVSEKARITVLHNGVVVQNAFDIEGPTAWIGHPPYEKHDCAPIRLQDHGNPVRFRNIWVRPL